MYTFNFNREYIEYNRETSLSVRKKIVTEPTYVQKIEGNRYLSPPLITTATTAVSPTTTARTLD